MELKNGDDDEEEKKLDLEFRRILRIIKIYIPCIMNINYVSSYRTWLEKLSGIPSSQKKERNRYLAELCRQIQIGVLEKPFNSPPQPGPLVPFAALPQNVGTSKAQNLESKQSDTYKSSPKKMSSHVKHIFSKNALSKEKVVTEKASHFKCRDKRNPKKRSKNTLRKKGLRKNYHDSLKPEPYASASSQNRQCRTTSNETYHEEDSLYLPLEDDYCIANNKISQPQNIETGRSIEPNDSSWLDLSHLSTASKMESGDSESYVHSKTHDNKIKALISLIAELKQQNLSLNSKAEVIAYKLEDEMRFLKNKLRKFDEMKAVVKSSQRAVASRWQGTVDCLNRRLYSAQSENAALSAENLSLRRKLEESSVQKQKDLAAVRQKLSELYGKEVETLKQNYVRHLVNLENKFTRILIEKEGVFNQKLTSLKQVYDEKISNISQSSIM